MSKRLIITTTDEPVILPVDVLIYISRLDDWEMSGPFARSSKTVLRAFTEKSILREMVTHAITKERPLFRWLLFGLPSCWISDIVWPTNPVKLPSVDKLFKKMHFYMRPNITANQCLISGGTVCQKLYGKEWEADMDLFIPLVGKRSTRMLVIYEDMKEADLVTKQFFPGEIQRSLDTFDLSIVQQGFVGDLFYQTPIALYSFLWQEIVALPDDVNMQYVKLWNKDGTQVGRPREVVVNIWEYIERHQNDHVVNLPIRYHECTKCHPESSRNKSLEHAGALTVWADRVVKYARRFPKFPIVYCRPPRR